MQKQMNDRRMKINKIKHILNAMEGSDNTMMAMIEGVMKLLQNKQGKVDNTGNKNGYVGCFIDDISRHLPHYKYPVKDITLAKCRKKCKGYRYLGLQNTRECYCGNKLVNIKYPMRPDSECNRACQGEPRRMCGGAWRNSVYTVQ